MRSLRLVALTGTALVMAAANLSAQSAPPGLCRVWIDGVPANRQPAPTNCDVARARAPRNARIIYGANTSNDRYGANTSNDRGYNSGNRNGDWRYTADQQRAAERNREQIERQREWARAERERELARIQRERALERDARLRREQTERDRYRHASDNRRDDRRDNHRP
ncbi:MAG: hypothetical protein JWM95_487 [Gemmatimonadetes bacterium]|nr:hypothetical protein [Gemmatimonadota bacterium]